MIDGQLLWMWLAGLGFGFLVRAEVQTWIDKRKPTPEPEQSDVGTMLLFAMMAKLKGTRQFMPPTNEVATTQEFDVGPDCYTLTLKLKARQETPS